MMNKFIFVWCLLHIQTYVGYSSQYSQKSSDDTQCILDVSKKIYNVTDLLQCMSEFAMNPLIKNNDGLKQTSRSNREIPYEFPFGNILLNLFNNKMPSIYPDFPNAITSNYPSIPNESFNQFGGLGINLYNALSSISRYDDLKCVSRILCEVASGRGRYRQASTGNDRQDYLGEFGTNAFAQWLAGSTEASPILSFARAAMVGYSSSGNPAMCYSAFPRCPRNPHKLLHYLNNYNGGFFRFFSRGERDSLSQLSYVSRVVNNKGELESLGERKQKALPPGIAGAEAHRTGTGKLNFGITVLATQKDKNNFFPKDNTLESLGQIVFSDREKSSEKEDDRPIKENRFSESLSDLPSSGANSFLHDFVPFFPQVSEEKDRRVLRFTPEVLDSAPAFRFPR